MLAIEGYREAQGAKYEIEYKMHKEHGRWMLMLYYNMQVEKKDRISDVQKFLQFSWEKEGKAIKEDTATRKQQIIAELKRIHNGTK